MNVYAFLLSDGTVISVQAESQAEAAKLVREGL